MGAGTGEGRDGRPSELGTLTVVLPGEGEAGASAAQKLSQIHGECERRLKAGEDGAQLENVFKEKTAALSAWKEETPSQET